MARGSRGTTGARRGWTPRVGPSVQPPAMATPVAAEGQLPTAFPHLGRVCRRHPACSPNAPLPRDHAIVIGGSIAGMCAARAIAPLYRPVTILDRDALPAGTDGRAGVPQGRHIHGLLAGGARALEELFPGFGARLVDGGAHQVDLFHDFAVLRPFGWFPRMRSNVPFLVASRGLTEATVRALSRAT